MNVHSKDEPDQLDGLIHQYHLLEGKLGLAILNDEDQSIGELDAELTGVRLKIVAFDCQSKHEQSLLADFLISHFIETKDVLSIVPKDVIERLRQLLV